MRVRRAPLMLMHARCLEWGEWANGVSEAEYGEWDR